MQQYVLCMLQYILKEKKEKVCNLEYSPYFSFQFNMHCTYVILFMTITIPCENLNEFMGFLWF